MKVVPPVIRRLAAAAVDLLFPTTCLLCRREVSAAGGHDPPGIRQDFCAGCLAEITSDLPRCSLCAAIVDRNPPGTCHDCSRRRPVWDGITVLSAYGDLVREAVLRGKRPSGDSITAGLGRLLARLLERSAADWRLDTVVAVPMHWRRRIRRGTTAADVIADAVASHLRLDRGRGLKRRRATRMQNQLPPHDRLANVHAAFRGSKSLRGRRVLLVDDVVTTGATITACTRAILAADARAVYVAAIAKAGHATATDHPSDVKAP